MCGGGKGCTKEFLTTSPAAILCYGWIDVNGYKSGPNKEVKCADGTKKLITENDYADCTVPNDKVTDVYPVVFYDSTVEPLTNAARYVLNTAK